MGILDNYLPQIGERLADRYRLEEEIGRGAFGIVYRAVHEGIDSDVAIKVLRPRVVDDSRVRKRFEREIAVAKTLKHPNTIRILDVDATLKGLPFYVMEYVDGETLQAALQREAPLSAQRTRRIASQIISSLSEAHALGIVHRDLKPANIMLYDLPGERDAVKVLDFGIAKALGEPQSFETEAGTVLGTPYYMSPEQASGQADIDGRADIYALGIILADCVGQPPLFEADSVLEHLAAQLSTAPLPFPEELAEHELWPVIERATQKALSHRYEKVEDMRDELEARRGAALASSGGPTQRDLSAPALAVVEPSQDDSLASRAGLRNANKGKGLAVAAAGVVCLGGLALTAATGPSPNPSTSNEASPPQVGAGDPLEAAGGEQETWRNPSPVVALARLEVADAVPDFTGLRFDGCDECEIVVGGNSIGASPLQMRVPALEHEFAFEARKGANVAVQVGRLTDGVIVVAEPVSQPLGAGSSVDSPPPARQPEAEVELVPELEPEPELGLEVEPVPGLEVEPEPGVEHEPSGRRTPFGAAPILD